MSKWRINIENNVGELIEERLKTYDKLNFLPQLHAETQRRCCGSGAMIPLRRRSTRCLA